MYILLYLATGDSNQTFDDKPWHFGHYPIFFKPHAGHICLGDELLQNEWSLLHLEVSKIQSRSGSCCQSNLGQCHVLNPFHFLHFQFSPSLLTVPCNNFRLFEYIYNPHFPHSLYWPEEDQHSLVETSSSLSIEVWSPATTRTVSYTTATSLSTSMSHFNCSSLTFILTYESAHLERLHDYDERLEFPWTWVIPQYLTAADHFILVTVHV